MAFIKEECEDIRIADVFTLVKEEPEDPIGCSSVWHSCSFLKNSVTDLLESWADEFSSGEEFAPESQSDSKTEQDLERSFSNTTENSLEPCMTTEKSSSSLIVTGDSIIHNLCSSPDLSPSSITEAEDENTTSKREERHTSIPEDTASDSVLSSKGITTRGGENFCFVCGKPQIKIARHFKVHKREDAEIARALSLPAHSKKRKELLQMLRNKGNFMHNNDVLKKGSGALKVKRRSLKQASNKYTYCVYCRGMFVRQVLKRHMKNCLAKRDHQEALGALGLAEVAKAAIPACSSVSDSQSFQSKSVPDLPESWVKDLLSGNEFVPESQSGLNSKTELDLERSISNTTENSLEPCITTEKKSSSLNVTGDVLIYNLSSSPDLSPSTITEAEDENTTNKREERNTSIPEDTASDSVSSSKGITTRGGENFCFVCGKPQIKIARHFKVHKREDAEIARALSLPAHSKKRKELLQMLRNKGNFMHNNDVLKKGSGALKVKRRSLKQASNKYTYCVYCRGMFIHQELKRHMKNCSAKRHHQEALGALGLAEVAKAAIPVCSSMCDPLSFQSKSVPDLPESLDKELSPGNEFVPQSQSGLNSKTELTLERTISNITENSLEPCMTTEKKSSCLDITAEDSLIHNLSSSPDLSPSSITEAEDENTTSKREERNASIPEDTASDSVLSSKGITTVSGGGENYCFVCGKPQIKIGRHFKVHKHEDAEIARALSLPAHSKKRKELLQMLRNKGNFMHNNDVLKKGTGALKVKRHSVNQASNKYTYCVYCRGMFVRQELKRHMKNCSAKRDHQEALGAWGLAEVAKAAIPVFSAVLDSHSFHKKSVIDLAESCEQELSSVEEFVPESQSGLNLNTDLDLERSLGNITENLPEPCMTSEKKASSLNITAGDSSPSSITEAEDENTTNKREERNTSIPEDTASDSVLSSKGITTRGGENFCFVCGKPQIKIARHFKVHKRENAEIARALSLPAHSKKRKELLQMLRNKGNFMHNNDVLKKGSGALKVKRHSVKQASNKYTYCIYCRGMFICQELKRHMKKCSAQRNHQEALGALGLAEVAKAAFPVCSSVWDSHSFHSNSVPDLPKTWDKELSSGEEFDSELQSGLNSNTELDLERSISNTTENSLDPCITPKLSSSLNVTAGDSLIPSLSFSPDLSPSSITEADDENTTNKREERNTSIPEDTASNSVSSFKGITTVSGGGENFCFVCGKPQIKIARHFKVHKRENAEIARALSLPAHSKKRKELLQFLRNKGNFMHNNDVLKKGSGALKVKRHSVKQASNKYTYCVYCRGMFVRHELKRHMQKCSAKRDHQGARGLAEVAKAAFSSTV
ncbi:uncharacterized protein LOC130221897 [Danio aesculapii]|uniref:uncharacterized protein LOC130221897 n=1 Tax=Danio aesculapii TaxID=1142201 RepID=UPI0024BF61D0|nr:uncharacterized protein LOC130221897 [Danio aesculapii]XP_056310414.1 uncharacterized protein LOC130221897 [Danio aesculapii]XP_056310415.1 uncharacterized protein LOC130221897 [Danio aesculapii]XP_056310416.1 uncharacterized protein LOC130221897 [Danio aesculapii]